MLDPDAVFTCPKLGKPLAIKACVRRRQEPRMVTVVIRTATENRTRITEQHADGPLHPFCALECELGREHAAAVGPPAPAPAPREPPPPGQHVWAAPDVPIGPAPASGSKPTPSYGMTGRPPKLRFVGGLVLDEDELGTPQDETEEQEQRLAPITEDAMRHAGESPAPPPAQPAPVTQEEHPMACTECKSRTMHKAICSHRPGGKNGRPLSAAEKASKPAKVKPQARPRPHPVSAAFLNATQKRIAGMVEKAAELPRIDLDAPVRELVAYRADRLEEVKAIDDELRRRQDEIRAVLSEQLQAVGG
jgi:hypothetical protein